MNEIMVSPVDLKRLQYPKSLTNPSANGSRHVRARLGARNDYTLLSAGPQAYPSHEEIQIDGLRR